MRLSSKGNLNRAVAGFREVDGGTVMTYGKGKYFGELALQVKQPRTPKPS